MDFVKSLRKESLMGISPAALAAFAISVGWEKVGVYRRFSDVYAADGMPEIVVPRSTVIDDYSLVVSDLIKIFAVQCGREDSAVFLDLTLADRDVIRVGGSEGWSDGLPVSALVSLLNGSRDMVLAAACSLDRPRPVYRAGSNKAANDYLGQLTFSRGELGRSALALVSPRLPPFQDSLLPGFVPGMAPGMARQVTGRLWESLTATREAAEQVSMGEVGGLDGRVAEGVSANLCEAIARMLDELAAFQVSVSFALTRPADAGSVEIGFDDSYSEVLRSAASELRAGAPVYDAHLVGFVHRLSRGLSENLGEVGLNAMVERRVYSVTAFLDERDYMQAIEAHKTKSLVSIVGDLERVGGRWRLDGARILDVVVPPVDC